MNYVNKILGRVGIIKLEEQALMPDAVEHLLDDQKQLTSFLVAQLERLSIRSGNSYLKVTLLDESKK